LKVNACFPARADASPRHRRPATGDRQTERNGAERNGTEVEKNSRASARTRVYRAGFLSGVYPTLVSGCQQQSERCNGAAAVRDRYSINRLHCFLISSQFLRSLISPYRVAGRFAPSPSSRPLVAGPRAIVKNLRRPPEREAPRAGSMFIQHFRDRWNGRRSFTVAAIEFAAYKHARLIKILDPHTTAAGSAGV